MLVVLFFCLLAFESSSAPAAENCDVYVAPSAVPGIGMGVFAARRFLPGDTVDIAPLYLRFERRRHDLFQTNLVDYLADKLWGWNADVLCFGLNHVINHNENNNVKVKDLQRMRIEGGKRKLGNHELGFVMHVAVKEIQPGEEIFDYFGTAFFRDRGLEERTNKSRFFDPTWEHRGPRCSKLAAGVGFESIQHMIDLGGHFRKPAIRFHDSGWGSASALVDLTPGMEIETAPALLLPLGHLRGTALAPLLLEWDHLNTTQQALLHTLHEQKTLHLHHRYGLGMSGRVDIWDESIVALLPLGRISMVQRVGHESAQANCEIWLRPITASRDHASAGVETVLAATKNVLKGQRLYLNLPSAGYLDEHVALLQELVDTGQPTPFALQGVRRHRSATQQQRRLNDDKVQEEQTNAFQNENHLEEMTRGIR